MSAEESNNPQRRIEMPCFLQLRPVDMVLRLKIVCEQSSQKKVAEKLGISPQYLSDILNGKREISSRLAEAMGFERVVTFVRSSREQGGSE